LGLPASARVVLLPSSLLPVATPSAPVSDVASLRVAIAGEGEAVVLIPGRAIAIEPLGVGGSAKPDKAVNSKGHARPRPAREDRSSGLFQTRPESTGKSGPSGRL
jgi:hypothetical protein